MEETRNMTEQEIEHALDYLNFTNAVEGYNLTEEANERCIRIMRGELDVDTVTQELVDFYRKES